MRISGFGAALVATLALAAPLSAQQPAPPAKMGPPAAGTKMDMPKMNMQMMDSMHARLDSAVARMNRTTGDARVTAMADVINALVSEQRMMHAHMQQMMGEHMGGMGEMGAMGHPAPGQPMGGMMHPDSGRAPMPGMARPDSVARPRK
jgi:hypothetical protein